MPVPTLVKCLESRWRHSSPKRSTWWKKVSVSHEFGQLWGNSINLGNTLKKTIVCNARILGLSVTFFYFCFCFHRYVIALLVTAVWAASSITLYCLKQCFLILTITPMQVTYQQQSSDQFNCKIPHTKHYLLEKKTICTQKRPESFCDSSKVVVFPHEYFRLSGLYFKPWNPLQTNRKGCRACKNLAERCIPLI